jgi:hypothetical protein
MTGQTHRGNRQPQHMRRLLMALVAMVLVAGSAPATPVFGGPDAGLASQESGGGGGP